MDDGHLQPSWRARDQAWLRHLLLRSGVADDVVASFGGAAQRRAARDTRRVRARIFWLHDKPLAKGDSILVRLGTRETRANVVAIEKAIDDLIAANPDKVEQARAKPTLAGWFVGQVMKATGGKANPQAVNELVKRKLGIE